MSITASFSAELFKLRKRPAIRVLAALLATLVVVFGYLLGGLVAGVGFEGERLPEGVDRAMADAVKQSLLPENLVGNVLATVAGLGGAIALILGALAVGSEYGWGTVKTVLTRRNQGRLGLLSGKFLGIATILLVLAVMSLTVGAVCSYVVASVEDAPINWPSLGEMLRGTGAAWLVLSSWAALGALLATLFRGTALAVGLGLVYALALETVVSGFQAQSEFVKTLSSALLGKNSADLAAAFGNLSPQLTPADPAEPWQAALVLGVYFAGCLLIAALLFKRRDVS